MTWDDGVTWRLDRVSSPDLSQDPLTVQEVRDDHLRGTNGSAEDTYVERLIRVSYARAERKSWRALCAQTWAQRMDRFPCREIVLQKFPVQSVTSITYVDEDGVTQVWGGSPAPYLTHIPTGPTAGKATIRPLYDETWPTSRVQLGAVTVTFLAGYPDVNGVCDIPEDLTHGRLLIISELYKQRSLSVHAFNQNPAIIQADNIFRDYRVY